MSKAMSGERFFRVWGTLIGFGFLLVFFSVVRPDAFPRLSNLSNVIEQAATLAIASSGVTMVMIAGDFDLSVGAIASFVGVAAARLMVADLGIIPTMFIPWNHRIRNA